MVAAGVAGVHRGLTEYVVMLRRVFLAHSLADVGFHMMFLMHQPRLHPRRLNHLLLQQTRLYLVMAVPVLVLAGVADALGPVLVTGVAVVIVPEVVHVLRDAPVIREIGLLPLGAGLPTGPLGVIPDLPMSHSNLPL